MAGRGDARIEKLQQQNKQLKAELQVQRIPVSEACKGYVRGRSARTEMVPVG